MIAGLDANSSEWVEPTFNRLPKQENTGNVNDKRLEIVPTRINLFNKID